ncbi:MAG: lipid-A-disaccharide synthase [Beijerinckiaceae bacterium]
MSESSGTALKIAIIAGEASGDSLGASLIETLAARHIKLSLLGVGGTRLEGRGLRSLFPQSDIAVMGIAAVLQRLPLLMRRINETAQAVAAAAPDLLLTIDSPDFTLRVARKVRAIAPQIPIVHWVCPSVWAWRPWRARRMAPHVDLVLCLLPFEPDELRKLNGPRGIYIGHPLIERIADLRPQSSRDREARANANAPEILLLPGSRKSEAKHLLRLFGEAAARFAAGAPRAQFILPAVEHLREMIESAVMAWPTRARIVTGDEAKLAAFRRARAAVAASGTVTLELALAGVPTVAVYRVAEWEAVIARRMIRVPSVLLPNLILGRNIMPELLQEDCTAAKIVERLAPLAAETVERASQLEAFAEIERRMKPSDLPPSARAGDEIMKMLTERREPR